MTLDEFNKLPLIMSFFPLTFETGRQKWTTFVVTCNDCKRSIPEDQTRGYAYREITGDSYRVISSTSYQLVAHALCPECNRLTTACYVLREDMTLSGIDNVTGKVSNWKMRRLTAWERFTDRLKTFFTTEKP